MRAFIRVAGVCLGVLLLSGCLFRRNRDADVASLNPGDQPDKILFEKAVHEIEKGRYDVGRLTLQTLINTYPDSEYLARAKLVIANSYYNEGGVAGLTQAEAEYKDFITFFPTAPEAPEAQFRAGMAHYRLMGKHDRDSTEAKLAEAELKEFLLKYPDSPLGPRVKARLRQVQEVLAQGEFKIAKFYFMKKANRAAMGRFREIAENYPNFSKADSALWYVGQSLERLKKSNEGAPYYARIITEHPLSPLVPDAQERLVAMHYPVPRPTKAVLARAEADAVPRPRKDLLQKMGGMLSSSPDISATRRGPVRLGQPPPSRVEVAAAPAPAPGGATIVAQPVSDASLKSGTPVSSSPAGNGAAGGNSGDPKAPADASGAQEKDKPAASSDPPAPPTKSKGRFRFLKKIVKPF